MNSHFIVGWIMIGVFALAGCSPKQASGNGMKDSFKAQYGSVRFSFGSINTESLSPSPSLDSVTFQTTSGQKGICPATHLGNDQWTFGTPRVGPGF